MFDNSFVLNNISIMQGKGDVFVAMPSFKKKQVDENKKAVYQEICFPVTKEFREKLYGEIINDYSFEILKKKRSTENYSL